MTSPHHTPQAPAFPTQLPLIRERLAAIEPAQYARSRNYLKGAVTRLSPYISRGVISLPQVAQTALQRYRLYEIEKFIQELAWREYWQRVWQAKGNAIFTDLKHEQPEVHHLGMVKSVTEAATGIQVIDEQIKVLYETGYLHNHVRMYLAAICCNAGGAHWLQPARWMYYYLLDGDLASNGLSWQWVAGSFSSKKYYCNQDNINHFTGSNQKGTFLDHDYPSLTEMPVPPELERWEQFHEITTLPSTRLPVLDPQLPLLIYNHYQLDATWLSDLNANRILLLEPAHFEQHPVSRRVLSFSLELAKNIPGIQVFAGNWTDLKPILPKEMIVHFKEHPAFTHYQGMATSRDWLFPEVSGYFPSFSAYWKKCSRYLKTLEARCREKK